MSERKNSDILNGKINKFSSEEFIESHSPKADMHIKIGKIKAGKVDAYVALKKGRTRDEAFETIVGFWLANKDRKMESDSALHLTTTASEVLCEKCGHVIPKIELALYNKNLGWVCLECDPTCHGNRAVAQKILKNMQLDRANNVLEAELAERTEKLEVMDNKEKVRELLLKIEQNVEERHETGKKVISFAKDFAKYSDFDIKAFFENSDKDDKRCHDILEKLTPILQFLERTASDQIAVPKRRRRRSLEASIEDME
jgi:hypothetical protein